MMVFLQLTLIALLGYASSYSSDEVTSLPGFNGVLKFKQYSGFLNARQGRKLHYWFVESQRNPSTDPLLLWMNGGPGCSSLLGLMTELGPFRVSQDSQVVTENPYSWNKFANVIFLEAPAGVGFSYDPSGAYSTDDDQTADDNYAAILDFFSKYPQYKSNDFYITGESYGGIYVPTLSVRVLRGNSDINFKGYAVGNGALGFPDLGNALIFFGYYHGLWGGSLWKALTDSCCNGSVSKETCTFSRTTDPNCAEAVDEANLIIQGSGLNVYNLYGKCLHSSSKRTTREHRDRRLIAKSLGVHNLEVGISPPCINDANVEDYLNRADVKKALHVTSSPLNFTECSGILNYREIYETMKPQVQELVNSGRLKTLVYNGDVDMACNFLGDEWFVNQLGYPATSEYKPWEYGDQVAGFAQTFRGNITFVTVKGSGHMVPGDKPAQALKMIGNFLFDKPF